MRITERALVLPTLYIIRRDGRVSTTKLIEELTDLFKPTGEDALILTGRNDTRFSQKVRNLRSHRDQNGMAELTEIGPEGYTLTPAGEKYLDENLEAVEYIFSNRFTGEDFTRAARVIGARRGQSRRVYVYSEADMISEGGSVRTETTARTRSKKLRNAAIERYRDPDGKIRCRVCGFCFEDRYGQLGQDFIEIHHEKPLYQYTEDDFEGYVAKAVEGVKPVCSNCHRMLHRDPKNPLTIDELKSRLH